jgi:hypothetical protein
VTRRGVAADVVDARASPGPGEISLQAAWRGRISVGEARAGLARARCLGGGTILATALVMLATIGARPAPACGCGMLFRAAETSEKALVTYSSGTETIVPGLTIERVGAHAAVLFPVPGLPHVRALPANLDIFGELESAIALVRLQTSSEPGQGRTGAPAPPRVIAREVVGGYNVTVLQGGTGHTVLAWLRAHHYALPRGASSILGSYATYHWYFVAMRLAARSAGEIKPLAISFPSASVVYPMRLSHLAKEPVSLELFVDTDGPIMASGIFGLTETFSGSVSTLASSLTPGVKALLPAPHFTQVEAQGVLPFLIRSDILLSSV